LILFQNNEGFADTISVLLLLLSFSNLSRHSFLLLVYRREVIQGQFWPKITHLNCFSFFYNWISDFHVISVFFCLFLWFRCLYRTLFVLIFYICTMCFLFLVLMRCLLDSSWKINFEQAQIRPMTLAALMLQIRRYEYSGNLNIVIFVDISTLSFYVINMDVVSLFAYSSFLFLVTLNLYYSINLIESISFFFVKKNTSSILDQFYYIWYRN